MTGKQLDRTKVLLVDYDGTSLLGASNWAAMLCTFSQKFTIMSE